MKSTRRNTVGHFVTTLNDASVTELAQEDKGYESGSETFNIPTPQQSTKNLPCLVKEDLSFDPAHFGQSPTKLVQHKET